MAILTAPAPHSEPTAIQGRTPLRPPHKPRHRLARRIDRLLAIPMDWLWRAFLVAVGLASFGLHAFRVDSSYDLFIDESFYSEVGQSIAHGHMPYATGVHFYLHPPGFFLVEALWMKVFGEHGEVFAQVYSLRQLVAIFAALTVVMLALIVDKAVGRGAAIFAASIYMINAFANRDSAIVILEPATLFWALAGYAVLMYLAPPGTRRRRWQIAGAGALFGLSVLTKEFAVFITLLPLVMAFLFRVWISRREALAAIGLTTLPYAVWVGIVVATHNWHAFYVQLTSGFQRTTGASQVSGFNRAGAPSFLDTILRNLSYLWTAYAILGLGSIAIVLVAVVTSPSRPNPSWSRLDRQRLRFLSLFGLGALPLIFYCIFIGTNEEQFFNFLLTPALICLVAFLWTQWSRLWLWVRIFAVTLAAAAVVSDSLEYYVVHTQPDNGTLLVDKWMGAHVPEHTVIAVTNSVQREIFLRYTMVDDQPGATLNHDVRYLVVFYKQVTEGYAFVDLPTVERQIQGLVPVFTTSDRGNGKMVIYAVP